MNLSYSTPPWRVHNFLLTVWSSDSIVTTWRWRSDWKLILTANDLCAQVTQVLFWFLSLTGSVNVIGFVIRVRRLHAWIHWTRRKSVVYVVVGIIWILLGLWWHFHHVSWVIFSNRAATANLLDTAGLITFLMDSNLWRFITIVTFRLPDSTCRQHSLSFLDDFILLLIHHLQFLESFFFFNSSFSFQKLL